MSNNGNRWNPKNFKAHDIPDTSVSLTDSLNNKTGSWRSMKPVIEDKYAPCIKACPTNTLIPQYFDQLIRGNLDAAGWILLEHNPIPSVTGRVCPHPCELGCNRGRYDQPISIREIERFVGDHILDKKGVPPKTETGKRVAVVGSGPAGMSAAFYLRRRGHTVVVFEKEEKGGGVLRYGIPEYRLPKDIVDREFLALERMGVQFKYNTTVGQDLSVEQLLQEYDAVFLGHGAMKERHMGIPGEEHFLSGLEFLWQVNHGNLKPPGKRVAVIGGGNVAMDVARALLRLGAEPIVLYRRTRKEMPALEEEVERALEDGIEFRFLTQPVAARKENGHIVLTCVKMQLGERDRSGRPRPVPVEGSEHDLVFDAVVAAIGEYVDTSFLPKEALDKDGWLVADKKTGRTPVKGLYAGGDAVLGPATVVEAVGMGRRAAEAIDAYLNGVEDYKPAPLPRTVSFKYIMTEYFPKAPRVEVPELPVEERIKDYFKEEVLGYDLDRAVKEALRCFSCGHCNSCGNCYVFCPDYAIKWVNDKPVVDYDYCKGCGICAQECPRGIITMEFERLF